MQKFFGFLLLAAVAAGAVWYESRPTTVKIPIETTDTTIYDGSDYLEQTTTEVPTSTEVQRPEVDFDSPDVTMTVAGTGGDEVRIREVIGKPQHLGNLPDDVAAMITSCEGVTDRDMAVQVDAKVELTSSLPAKVTVDYGTLLNPALFEFTSGLKCSEGSVDHDLHPGRYSHLTYWVVLSGVVTPDHPNGNFGASSWTLRGLNVTLPNLGTYTWKEWGPRVRNCGGILGTNAEIWLAGRAPSDCPAAQTEALALGTS